MSDIFLKPYKPAARHRTDIFTYIVRFICGCFFGLFVGVYIAYRTNSGTAQVAALDGEATFNVSFYFTLIGVTLLIGIFASLLGDSFWGMFKKRSYY